MLTIGALSRKLSLHDDIDMPIVNTNIDSFNMLVFIYFNILFNSLAIVRYKAKLTPKDQVRCNG